MATITTTITIDNVDGEPKTVTGVCNLESDAIFTSKQTITTSNVRLGTRDIREGSTMILKNTSAENDLALVVTFNINNDVVTLNVPPGQIAVVPYLWTTMTSGTASEVSTRVNTVEAYASADTIDVEYCIIY